MGDALVQLQDWVAQYPTWLVAGGIGFLVVVVTIVVWKAMKVAMTALLVGLVVAVAWYLWENVSARDDHASARAVAPGALEGN